MSVAKTGNHFTTSREMRNDDAPLYYSEKPVRRATGTTHEEEQQVTSPDRSRQRHGIHTSFTGRSGAAMKRTQCRAAPSPQPPATTPVLMLYIAVYPCCLNKEVLRYSQQRT